MEKANQQEFYFSLDECQKWIISLDYVECEVQRMAEDHYGQAQLAPCHLIRLFRW